MPRMKWKNVSDLVSFPFRCGHCGQFMASDKGFIATVDSGPLHLIYLCSHCTQPNYFDGDEVQTPGASFGAKVDHVSDASVEALYDEARNCMRVNAFTAAILCCRKLLMNVGVSKGAEQGLNFIEYVDFLAGKNYVPPDGKEWVDHIRTKGNEATHEIQMKSKEEAEELISFIEMLLKFIYEFPGRIKPKTPG